MNSTAIISTFCQDCKMPPHPALFYHLAGRKRKIKINCMPIKCLFLIENLQMMWKCKTGYTVNQKQITHTSRHTLLFLWACFTIHSLCCLSFWKLVIISLIQRNMWMAVQQAMKIRTKLSISAALWIRLSQISAWRILAGGSSLEHPLKALYKGAEEGSLTCSSWFKMVVLQRMTIDHPVSSGHCIFYSGKMR